MADKDLWEPLSQPPCPPEKFTLKLFSKTVMSNSSLKDSSVKGRKKSQKYPHRRVS